MPSSCATTGHSATCSELPIHPNPNIINFFTNHKAATLKEYDSYQIILLTQGSKTTYPYINPLAHAAIGAILSQCLSI